MNQIVTATPIGRLAAIYEGEYLVEVKHVAPQTRPTANKEPFTRAIERQLQAYFDGDLRIFDLPFVFPAATEYQMRVWQQIRKIPYGETRTYGEIAADIKSGPRAVGGACGANRLLLIVPCHRVVGATGLGGFMRDADGSLVRRKQWLLGHEQKYCNLVRHKQ